MYIRLRDLTGCVLLGVLMTTAPALGVIIGDVAINPANGHAYYLLDAASWTASQAEAETLTGHLVTIGDAAEQAWVWSTFGGQRELWIGLVADTPEPEDGPFAWVSGEPLSYANWAIAEPKRYRGDKLYGEMTAAWTGQWAHAADDARRHYGVVEIELAHVPAPGAGVLALIGIGLAVRNRRRRRAGLA